MHSESGTGRLRRLFVVQGLPVTLRRHGNLKNDSAFQQTGHGQFWPHPFKCEKAPEMYDRHKALEHASEARL